MSTVNIGPQPQVSQSIRLSSNSRNHVHIVTKLNVSVVRPQWTSTRQKYLILSKSMDRNQLPRPWAKQNSSTSDLAQTISRWQRNNLCLKMTSSSRTPSSLVEVVCSKTAASTSIWWNKIAATKERTKRASLRPSTAKTSISPSWQSFNRLFLCHQKKSVSRPSYR